MKVTKEAPKKKVQKNMKELEIVADLVPIQGSNQLKERYSLRIYMIIEILKMQRMKE